MCDPTGSRHSNWFKRTGLNKHPPKIWTHSTTWKHFVVKAIIEYFFFSNIVFYIFNFVCWKKKKKISLNENLKSRFLKCFNFINIAISTNPYQRWKLEIKSNKNHTIFFEFWEFQSFKFSLKVVETQYMS